jgi:hypothetical protein
VDIEPVGDRWSTTAVYDRSNGFAIDDRDDRWERLATDATAPFMLTGFQAPPEGSFRVVFRGSGNNVNSYARFIFHDDPGRSRNQLMLYLNTGGAPYGEVYEQGVYSSVSETRTSANMPSAPSGGGGWVWFDIRCDGTTVQVRAIQQTAEPTNAQWDAASVCYESTGFVPPEGGSGGGLGFVGSQDDVYLDDFTLHVDTDDDADVTSRSTYEAIALADDFVADSDGFQDTDVTYDAAGNLTADGVFQYAYDAWNRLTLVHYAPPGSTTAPGNTLPGLQVAQYRYDGNGRRIVRELFSGGSGGVWHDYYADQRHIETRNGSGQVVQQYVWGGTYIDELVQVKVNQNPTGDPDFDPGETGHDAFTGYTLTDSMYNVVLLLDASSGGVVERYEYSPYGARQVYTTTGTSDELATTPVGSSHHLAFGHQGLLHDDETAGRTVYNRARTRHTVLRRFMQRDPLGYVDGMSVYSSYWAIRGAADPNGTSAGAAGAIIAGAALGYQIAQGASSSREDTHWDFDQLEGTIFVGDQIQRGLTNWEREEEEITFKAFSRLGRQRVLIVWEVSFFYKDGHISQLIPSISNADDDFCWGGSVSVEVFPMPNATPHIRTGRPVKVVELRATYTVEAPFSRAIAFSNWEIRGDGTVARRRWEDNGHSVQEGIELDP